MPPSDLAKQGVIRSITKLHAQWQVATAKKKRRLPFPIFLRNHDEQLFVILLGNPGLYDELPIEVKRALRPPKGRKIGPAVLREYATALYRRYVAEGAQETFEEFIQAVTERCTTEGELKAWLGLDKQ